MSSSDIKLKKMMTRRFTIDNMSFICKIYEILQHKAVKGFILRLLFSQLSSAYTKGQIIELKLRDCRTNMLLQGVSTVNYNRATRNTLSAD